MVMGLDKGLDLVRKEPQPNGPSRMLTFQFCPSCQQVRVERSTVDVSYPWAQSSTVPVGYKDQYPVSSVGGCERFVIDVVLSEQMQNVPGYQKFGRKILGNRAGQKWLSAYNKYVKEGDIPVFYSQSIRYGERHYSKGACRGVWLVLCRSACRDRARWGAFILSSLWYTILDMV
jgi:hypothetical protein